VSDKPKVDPRYDWKPVLSADRVTYCSPSCGGKCSRFAYLNAKEKARKLKERLGGEGWLTRIWENLGWHYEVRHPKSHLIVTPKANGGYVALIEGFRGDGLHAHTAANRALVRAMNMSRRLAELVRAAPEEL